MFQNYKFQNLKFQVPKFQNFKFQIFKYQNSKPQVSNSKFQVLESQVANFQIQNFQFPIPSFKFQKSNLFQRTTKINQSFLYKNLISKLRRNKWKSHISKTTWLQSPHHLKPNPKFWLFGGNNMIKVEKPFVWHFNSSNRSRKALWSTFQQKDRGRKTIWSTFQQKD